MSDTPDEELEQLVEKHARGESAGLPVEQTQSGAEQLDTRRSKSGLAAAGLYGDAGHVDIQGAEVDGPAFIAQQSGIHLDTPAPDTLAHHTAAAQPIRMAGGEVDVAYPDVVDRPEYIEAHMRPGLGDMPMTNAGTDAAQLAQSAATTNAPEIGQVAPSEVALTANVYPDTVDQPAFIEAHAGAALVRDDSTTLAQAANPRTPDSGRMLGEERTPETEVQIGDPRPA
jgi:hypothetical protein